ncbi:pyridoxamine 5'-phosphate oxidase family protein [Yinghuangia sp. YIM S09857]|uniref:pyridoxamine 5'-phosphate oxidase family protein n=1 Tax=Yinghuangia sp. YIM S09857 TaxID=3436929 RepID=UPI003F539643
MTTTPAPVLEELTASEALRLMAGVPVGRVVFTQGALPAIRPVPFFLDSAGPLDPAAPVDPAAAAPAARPGPAAIVFRVIGDRHLAATLHKSVVAFQADDCDTQRHGGWSVTATGHAVRVDDPAEVDRLTRRLPAAWADHGVVFRIEPELVAGRRLNR